MEKTDIKSMNLGGTLTVCGNTWRKTFPRKADLPVVGSEAGFLLWGDDKYLQRTGRKAGGAVYVHESYDGACTDFGAGRHEKVSVCPRGRQCDRECDALQAWQFRVYFLAGGLPYGFCFRASTLDGLVRGLTPAEMLDQIYQIGKDIGERISNVVVMGTGSRSTILNSA